MPVQQVRVGGPTPEERVEAANRAEIPHLYFSGFMCSLSNADVILVGERAGVPVATVNLSFTIAKTLAASLANVVSTLEEKMGREIMTTHDIDKRMSEDKSK